MLSVAFWGLYFASARPLDSQMGAAGCSVHSSLAVLSSLASGFLPSSVVQPETRDLHADFLSSFPG